MLPYCRSVLWPVWSGQQLTDLPRRQPHHQRRGVAPWRLVFMVAGESGYMTLSKITTSTPPMASTRAMIQLCPARVFSGGIAPSRASPRSAP